MNLGEKLNLADYSTLEGILGFSGLITLDCLKQYYISAGVNVAAMGLYLSTRASYSKHPKRALLLFNAGLTVAGLASVATALYEQNPLQYAVGIAYMILSGIGTYFLETKHFSNKT